MLRWLEDGARPASVVPNESLLAALAEWQRKQHYGSADAAATGAAATSAAATGEEKKADPEEIFKTCMKQARLGQFVKVRRVVGK